jgi:hypothetical protein
MRSRPERFKPNDGGTWIDDDDFGFDAMLKVDGDFGSDADRLAYAQFICDKLNAPEAIPAPEGAQLPPLPDVNESLEFRRLWDLITQWAEASPGSQSCIDVADAIDAHISEMLADYGDACAALAAPAPKIHPDGAVNPTPQTPVECSVCGGIVIGVAAPAPQAPVALAQEQWPPTPSAYQGDQYIGYSRTDLLKYAQEVLAAHGIPAPQTKEPTNDR